MKKTIIHILAFFIKVANFLQKALAPIIHMTTHIMGRILFSVLLPFYNVYLYVKRIFIKFYSPLQSKHRLIHFFARRYVTHILIIVISFIVSTANLNANEVKKDDMGYKNILSKLVEKEDYDILQEERQTGSTLAASQYYNRSGVENKYGVDYDTGANIGPEIVASQGAIVKPVLSPIESEMRLRNEVIVYEVGAGDTISDIGQKFGISVNTILWENNLTGYSIIKPGQKLTILPTSGVRYKVARGDTVQKIAKTYNANIEDILEFNKLASIEDIKIGETLMVPGGRKQAASQPYALRLTAPANTVVSGTVSLGKLLWPSVCKRITQYYSWRHSGIDIACGLGNSVEAAGSGTVIRAQGGWNGGYGNVIIIDHGNGLQSLYGHLSKISVKVGDVIEGGQVIGLEGSTGRSTGSHVHFEVRIGGSRKNPLTSVK